MKKLTRGLAGVLAAVMLGSAMPALAANTDYSAAADLKPSFSVVVEGTKAGFYDANNSFVFPVVYNGSTYLPLRAIANLMGKNVTWDQATETITLDGSGTVTTQAAAQDWQLPADSSIYVTVKTAITVKIDGVVRSFQDANGATVYPINYNGTTYLPVRAIGGIMGKDVGWNGNASAVFLGRQPTEKESRLINYVYGIKNSAAQIQKLAATMDRTVNQQNVDANIAVLENIQQCVSNMQALPKPDGYEDAITAVDKGLASYSNGLSTFKTALMSVKNATAANMQDAAYVQSINDTITTATTQLKTAETQLQTGGNMLGKLEIMQ